MIDKVELKDNEVKEVAGGETGSLSWNKMCQMAILSNKKDDARNYYKKLAASGAPKTALLVMEDLFSRQFPGESIKS